MDLCNLCPEKPSPLSSLSPNKGNPYARDLNFYQARENLCHCPFFHSKQRENQCPCPCFFQTRETLWPCSQFVPSKDPQLSTFSTNLVALSQFRLFSSTFINFHPLSSTFVFFYPSIHFQQLSTFCTNLVAMSQGLRCGPVNGAQCAFHILVS